MKKLLTLTFVLLLTVALAACGGKKEATPVPEEAAAVQDEATAEPDTEPATNDATAVFNAAMQQNLETVMTGRVAGDQKWSPATRPSRW